MKKIAIAVATLFAVNAFAGDLSQIGTLTQNQFLKLSTDLGAASSYKGVTPATPLGLSGFDIGVELTQTSIENSPVFRQAGAGDVSNLYVPKIHITKGLPAGFDIGALVSRVSGVDGTLIGLEARYAILDDGLATPALGVRLSGSKLSGVNRLDLSTIAVDAMLSKKLTLITPYIGAGSVRVKSSAAVAGLREESFNKSRVFVGLNANFLLANVAVEAEKMGDNTSLSAKAGFRF
ncbi:MAG: hypothetical protein LH481_01255 [Burkholderiales bacterium]|nr:hypothetical protein [Burkholderiales bacterium]